MMNNATLEQRFGAVFNLVVVHYCVIGAYLATPFLTNAFIGGMTSAGGLGSWAASKGANLPGAAARTAQSVSRMGASGGSARSSNSTSRRSTSTNATEKPASQGIEREQAFARYSSNPKRKTDHES